MARVRGIAPTTTAAGSCAIQSLWSGPAPSQAPFGSTPGRCAPGWCRRPRPSYTRAALEAFEVELLEQAVVIDDRPAPFAIVIVLYDTSVTFHGCRKQSFAGQWQFIEMQYRQRSSER